MVGTANNIFKKFDRHLEGEFEIPGDAMQCLRRQYFFRCQARCQKSQYEDLNYIEIFFHRFFYRHFINHRGKRKSLM